MSSVQFIWKIYKVLWVSGEKRAYTRRLTIKMKKRSKRRRGLRCFESEEACEQPQFEAITMKNSLLKLAVARLHMLEHSSGGGGERLVDVAQSALAEALKRLSRRRLHSCGAR